MIILGVRPACQTRVDSFSRAQITQLPYLDSKERQNRDQLSFHLVWHFALIIPPFKSIDIKFNVPRLLKPKKIAHKRKV